MMDKEEASLIRRLIDIEGGYVNHPNDKGGPTKYGITAETLGRWRKLGRKATATEVRALTMAEATAIFSAWWWRSTSLRLDLIPGSRLRWWALDAAVLFGQKRAGQFMQRAAAVKADGIMGPISVSVISTIPENAMLVRCTTIRCMHHANVTRDDPTQAVFISGWMDRALKHLDHMK